MTSLHYPDNLYADHEERKAMARQTPVGAYRAPTEMPEAERKLRTALAYVNHARDLIRDALGDNEPKAQREAKIAYDLATEEGRVPKWDPRWAAEQSRDGVLKDLRDYGSAFVRHAWEDGELKAAHVPLESVYVTVPPPNCDGLSARDIRAPHPMQAEAIRDHDERLAGGEDRL